MSRGREWAEELAAMAAQQHARPVPSDDSARVVLTAEERQMGWRADRQLPLKRLVSSRVKAVIESVTESVESLKRTMEGAVRSVDEFAAEMKKFGKDE